MGGQPPGMDEMPALWNSYLAVEDCGATAAKAEAAGGSVMMPPMEVANDSGEMAILTDPTGAAISIWKAGEHFGAGVANEVNTWSWNELLTRDVDAALGFYTDVFGWSFDIMEMPDGSTYNLIQGGTEDQGMGGIMAMPAEMPDMVPNHWSVYFTVADLDASLGTIKDNGGSVVVEPMSVPGVGTFATVHDPAGGNFNVIQPEGG